MPAPSNITIVGGGLAGLTLGIGLRQRAVDVRVFEAGRYPRHRVCGEFINGRGLAVLERLGLLNRLESEGAVVARTAAFFAHRRSSGVRPLPEAALCLSRHTLDAALASELRRQGGELFEQQRHAADSMTAGMVWATGRRAAASDDPGVRWFGAKAHARSVSLAADLEMHLSPQGYVGLCRIDERTVNVCGLFRRQPGDSEPPSSRLDRLRGASGSVLSARLAAAEFDPASFCAVGGISLHPQRAKQRAGCCIGDAITMIPPVTGNGMSMALESAGLAVPPLTAWNRGERSWDGTRDAIATACDRAFARRLRWAHWLQRLILSPHWQEPLVALAGASAVFRRTVFFLTR